MNQVKMKCFATMFVALVLGLFTAFNVEAKDANPLESAFIEKKHSKGEAIPPSLPVPVKKDVVVWYIKESRLHPNYKGSTNMIEYRIVSQQMVHGLRCIVSYPPFGKGKEYPVLVEYEDKKTASSVSIIVKPGNEISPGIFSPPQAQAIKITFTEKVSDNELRHEIGYVDIGGLFYMGPEMYIVSPISPEALKWKLQEGK